MPRCFVIQPFDDKGPFDQRYEEVLSPAIEAADLETYRVDRDPRVSIPIESIERGIQSSKVCLADITQDNPNVWFEVGYAIAAQKEVVFICSEERGAPFPFDVQHRTITKYATKSPSDFKALQEKITQRLKAILRQFPQLTVGRWILWQAIDKAGTDWSGSTLRFTSQVESKDSLELRGFFEWMARGCLQGTEDVTGYYDCRSRKVSLKGNRAATVKDGSTAVASYSAVLSEDANLLRDGTWVDFEGIGVIPGLWQATR